MKKYLLKIGLFFLVIIVFDVLWGKAFSYMVDHAKGGHNWRNNYICNEVHEDVLVFGSSRGVQHYNSTILEDSLGMSCYNCGQGGNGTILNYARYQLIRQRYHPKVLIYDVIPGFDFIARSDNQRCFDLLRAYYDRKGIPEIFEAIDATEKYKMISGMYQYNSRFTRILTDYIHPRQEAGIKGFLPKHEEMDTLKIKRRNLEEEKKFQPVYDPLKMEYFNRIVDESDDTQIIFVVSPWWDGADTIPYQIVKEICKERNIPFLDFSNDPKYVHHNEYFHDSAHMNARGADEFTRDLVHVLKERGLIEPSAEKK